MKKYLILSTCLVSLTSSSLFASDNQQSQIEEQEMLLSQFAVSAAEKTQDNEVILTALLSNPDLATPEEIQKLSPTLQIEYFVRLTAQEEPTRANSSSSASSSSSSATTTYVEPAPMGDDEYDQLKNQMIEKRVQELLKQNNPDLSKVGEVIVLKYFEALAAKELAASSSSSANSSSTSSTSQASQEGQTANQRQVNSNDMFEIGNLNKQIEKEYYNQLELIENGNFPQNNLLMVYRQTLEDNSTDDQAVADVYDMQVQQIPNLRQRVAQRIQDLGVIAKAMGVAVPGDKEALVAAFMKKENCSREFAESVYDSLY